MFWGKSFIFDGVSSEIYNLGIINMGTGMEDSPAGADVELFTKQIYRKPKNYLLGVSQKPVLTFPITIGSPDKIDAYTRDLIEQWLFGQQGYKKLKIVQNDLQNVYYNCFLTEPTSTFAGNLNYVFKTKVVCDSPFAYEEANTLTKTYGEVLTSETFTFVNYSANADYTYPSITFSTNSLGNSFSLTNITDNNRAFAFSGISPNETITADCDKQILTSSTGLYRISKFNLNWFRLLPGFNTLTLAGGVSSFNMTYQNARKVGG